MDSKKKLVLFICPAFFGYEVAITNAIINNGFDVDFFDERTSNNSFYKAIFRVEKSLLNKTIKKYYSRISKKIKSKSYAYFLLIKGEVVPEWFIVEFKKNNPTAKLIYYTYDSFNNNNTNSLYILKHFDSCFSFDFEDVKSNPSLSLKHLFYTEEYNSPAGVAKLKKYSVSFIGTLHSARYTIVKNLFNSFDDTFTFFYVPAKWFFLLEKTLKKSFRNIQWDEVSFDKLSKQQVADIFMASKSVLDIQRSGQTGLTMRTFEVLASGAILITTNSYIKQTDFYRDNRIIVLDTVISANNILEIKSKIDAIKPNDNLSILNIKKYSVDNWVKEFFE